MQWVRVLPVFGAAVIALAIALPESSVAPKSDPPSPVTPPRTNAPPPANPFDTIRTNLRDYQWPTDAGRLVTSTFGEYRRTHFHGGIDISTGDITGYRVFATRAGDVVRARVDPDGYGKMLFIRHPDGYTTTYAHLRNFAPAIEGRIRAEQERLERYPVNLEFGRGEISVRKGELVAFTGETGSGSPHLHFEIRDEHMNAVNPMLAPALRVEDDIPPVFRKLSILPLTPGSTVNERSDPVIFSVRMTGRHSFTIARPVSISGTAGLAVYVRDRANGTHYSRGVYRHRLLLDGHLFFEVRFDRVPMAESQQIGLYYVRDLLRSREGRFEKLFVDRGNRLPMFSNPEKGSGFLSLESLSPGKHTFTILSEDFGGNSSTLSGSIQLTPLPPKVSATEAHGAITLSLSRPGHATSVLVDRQGYGGKNWARVPVLVQWDSTGSSGSFALPPALDGIVRIRVANGDDPLSSPVFLAFGTPHDSAPAIQLHLQVVSSGIQVETTSDGVFTTIPILAVEEGGVRRIFPMSSENEHRYQATIVPLDTVAGRRTIVFEGMINAAPVRAVEQIDVYPILPGRSGTISIDGGNLQLEYDSLSVYDTLYLQPRVLNSDGSRTYELLPEGAILRNGFAVTMRTDRPLDKQAIYRRTGGDWSLLSRSGNPTGEQKTGRMTERLGSLALLHDSEPPVVSRFRFFRSGRNSTLATFRIRDELSGVDYKSVKAYIDGKFVVPEIDGEHHRVTVISPEGLTRGSHHLQVRAQDNMGNSTLLERGFVVR